MPHLRVEENLLYPLLLQGVSKDEAQRRAWEPLCSVLRPEEQGEIEALMRRFPSQLAGGQRQRVALAQAMIHDPYVLFADEPAGHLDPSTRDQVMGVLREWVTGGQGKRCLVWVTHHADDPEQMRVDHIICVAGGDCECIENPKARTRFFPGGWPMEYSYSSKMTDPSDSDTLPSGNEEGELQPDPPGPAKLRTDMLEGKRGRDDLAQTRWLPKVPVWLGWIEWCRSFFRGQRDFLWLSLLLSLTLTLALLVWGSREGLLTQFIHVSLGYLRGHGIPIWVVSELDIASGTSIDRDIIKRIREIPGVNSVHPYREVEGYEVSLPGDRDDRNPVNIKFSPAWGKGRVAFNGWAVSIQDPLWKLAEASGGSEHPKAGVAGPLPLDIVLSRGLFQKHFDCRTYIEALSRQLPQAKLPKIKVQQGNNHLPSCLADGILWLAACRSENATP